MAIKFEKITAGMKLWQVARTRSIMGDLGVWPVEIVSVDHDSRTAEVEWNHNRARTWTARQLEKLYTDPMRHGGYRKQREAGR